jgi:protein TonB
VVVKVHILANGNVAMAEVSRSAGHPLLDRAAVESIRAAQFIPARRGGDPVPVWVEVPVQFKLER